MLRRIVLAVGLLLVAGVGQALAQAADHWRVIVQDAAIHPLAVSADGALVAARGEYAPALFHVFDPDSADILLSVPMPYAILSAAIAPDGNSFIVSTHEHIYRVQRNDGAAQRLLANTAGLVALDPAGEQLAVLNEREGQQPISRYGRDATQLCVYDLKHGQWKSKIKTPIKVAMWLTFDSEMITAAGLGGLIGARTGRGSYPCHVELELSTGKHTIQKGPGAPTSDDAHSMYHEPEGEPFVPPTPDYAFPPAIQKLIARIEAVSPQSATDQARFTAHSDGYNGSVFALVADDQRIAALTDHGRGRRSLLTITSAGAITTVDAPQASSVQVCRGRIVQQDGGQIIDVETGKVVTTLPQFPYQVGEENQWDQFVGSGWLVRDRGRFGYYVPGYDGPLWHRECPEDLVKFTQVVSSTDASRLAFCVRNGEVTFYVVDAATGKFLMLPRRNAESDSNFPVSHAAFNADGSKLMMIYNATREEDHESLISKVRPDLYSPRIVHYSMIREYDLASETITYERELGEHEYYGSIVPTPGGWIFGGGEESLYIDGTTHAETTIPLGGIDWAAAIPGREDQALLVENRQAVVTPNGKVLHTWFDDWGGVRRSRERIPTSGIAMGGKVIARRTGTTEVELLDSQTLHTIAWVHMIHLEQSVGWIAYTPDGHWDASPEAEKFVLTTKNGTLTTSDERQTRRTPLLLQSRLPR